MQSADQRLAKTSWNLCFRAAVIACEQAPTTGAGFLGTWNLGSGTWIWNLDPPCNGYCGGGPFSTREIRARSQ